MHASVEGVQTRHCSPIQGMPKAMLFKKLPLKSEVAVVLQNPNLRRRHLPLRRVNGLPFMPARTNAPKAPKRATTSVDLQALGFRVAESGPHTSKTLMLQELEALLEAVPADAPAKAIGQRSWRRTCWESLPQAVRKPPQAQGPAWPRPHQTAVSGVASALGRRSGCTPPVGLAQWPSPRPSADGHCNAGDWDDPGPGAATLRDGGGCSGLQPGPTQPQGARCGGPQHRQQLDSKRTPQRQSQETAAFTEAPSGGSSPSDVAGLRQRQARQSTVQHSLGSSARHIKRRITGACGAGQAPGFAQALPRRWGGLNRSQWP